MPTASTSNNKGIDTQNETINTSRSKPITININRQLSTNLETTLTEDCSINISGLTTNTNNLTTNSTSNKNFNNNMLSSRKPQRVNSPSVHFPAVNNKNQSGNTTVRPISGSAKEKKPQKILIQNDPQDSRAAQILIT